MTRRDADAPMENENRRRVYAAVRDHPGLHPGELERRTGLPAGTLAYHLQHLEELGLVEAREESYYKRYFVRGHVGRGDRDLLRVLRQGVPRRILAQLLVENAGLAHAEIAERFNLAPSTISYHLAKLVRVGLVARDGVERGSRYRLVNAPSVARSLLTYRATLLDGVVDRVLAVWLELHP